MRLLLPTLAHLAFFSILASAAPKVWNFEEVAESASEHGLDALAGTHSESHQPIWLPQHKASTTATVPFPFQESGGVGTFSHHPSSPFSPVGTSNTVDGDRAGPSVRRTPVARFRTVSVVSPRIDLEFVAMLKAQSQQDTLQLPLDITYIESTWLDPLYERLIKTLPELRSIVPSFKGLDVPEVLIEDAITRKRYLFQIGRDVYVWQIPNQWLAEVGIFKPVQVLFKYHPKLWWDDNKANGGKQIYDTIFFWNMADRGKKLVLLRVFHITKQGWEYIENKALHIQRYEIIGQPQGQNRISRGPLLLPRARRASTE